MVKQLGCCRLILLLKLSFHLLKLWISIGILSIQIQESFFPKGTTPVSQSLEKWNWKVQISSISIVCVSIISSFSFYYQKQGSTTNINCHWFEMKHSYCKYFIRIDALHMPNTNKIYLFNYSNQSFEESIISFMNFIQEYVQKL